MKYSHHLSAALHMQESGDTMTDQEILESLVRATYPGPEAREICAALWDRFGTLAEIVAAPAGTLNAVIDPLPVSHTGLLVTLKALQVAAVRLGRNDLADRDLISSWDRLTAYLNRTMARDPLEQVRGLFLDRKNKLLADIQLGRGTVDQTPLYTREVVKAAMDHFASAVILAHNHPSGDSCPSQQDIDTTTEIKNALKPLGIALHDHVIIARSDYFSFRGTGLI